MMGNRSKPIAPSFDDNAPVSLSPRALAVALNRKLAQTHRVLTKKANFDLYVLLDTRTGERKTMEFTEVLELARGVGVLAPLRDLRRGHA